MRARRQGAQLPRHTPRENSICRAPTSPVPRRAFRSFQMRRSNIPSYYRTRPEVSGLSSRCTESPFGCWTAAVSRRPSFSTLERSHSVSSGAVSSLRPSTPLRIVELYVSFASSSSSSCHLRPRRYESCRATPRYYEDPPGATFGDETGLVTLPTILGDFPPSQVTGQGPIERWATDFGQTGEAWKGLHLGHCMDMD